MSKTRFDDKALGEFKSALSTARQIVITCHLSPDGDALGSSLGLKCVLKRLNPTARTHIITPDEPTRTLSFLPEYTSITAYSSHPIKSASLIHQADVIVCLDFNELARTDLLKPYLAQASATKILVDHHLNPENFAHIQFSFPDKCATCMLLFELLEASRCEEYISKDAADCLLAGMMTDTGDFSYNVSDAYIYTVIGKLIDKGADKGRLTHLLFNTFSETNLRIQGFALAKRMDVFNEEHAALITLDREDLNLFGYHKGDTEGLVNKPLAIPGILYSCYLRQETGYIKVSMRSLGDFPVNKVCSDYFGGGGHLNAAGGEFYGTMDECVSTFKKILSENLKKYIEPSHLLNDILNEELKSVKRK